MENLRICFFIKPWVLTLLYFLMIVLFFIAVSSIIVSPLNDCFISISKWLSSSSVIRNRTITLKEKTPGSFCPFSYHGKLVKVGLRVFVHQIHWSWEKALCVLFPVFYLFLKFDLNYLPLLCNLPFVNIFMSKTFLLLWFVTHHR